MKKYTFVFLAFIGLFSIACTQKTGNKKMVLYPVSTDPTISFRILFRTGSQDDPAGKEGLAALTAAMISRGSTKKHSYEQLLELLYPMAASISSQVDKEMSVFSGRIHKDNLNDYFDLFKEIILEPAFNENDFKRIKSNFINNIQKNVRYADDEELGKEVLSEFIFSGTPYGHLEEGHVSSLKSITLDDVKAFYRAHYTRAALLIGLGGGYPADFPATVKAAFDALPEGTAPQTAISRPEAIKGLQVEIVEKNVPATAISFGFPIDISRGDKDFYALALATSWLGEHRNSSSHLYQVIREKRGLNYGDYAYIEHFPNGGRRQFPPANVARRQQIFQIWIRPVPNNARLFAFRAALRELHKLVDNGLTQEEFELTRNFLKNYIAHYAPTTFQKLGYALDDVFYGINGHYLDNFPKMMEKLTLNDVNRAIKKHLQYQNLKAVFITGDAEQLKEALVNNSPSPIKYSTPKSGAILREDKEIAAYPLKVSADNVKIVPVDKVFE